MTIPCIDDKRGLLFTIGGEPDPLYQVESSAWCQPENRWERSEIPAEIRAKVAELVDSGKPGAFVRFVSGEVGVYVICEKNIKTLPEVAGDELLFTPPTPGGAERALSSYDIIICAKAGTVRTAGGEAVTTQEGDYYVIGSPAWSRVILEEGDRPRFVETTKEILHLLEALNGKNFLSMSPDPSEMSPRLLPAPHPATDGINCYVLNLARFELGAPTNP